MSYAHFEDQIIARLEGSEVITTACTLYAWADNPAFDYGRPLAKGNLLVRFLGEVSPEPGTQNTRGGIQLCQLTFDIRLLIKNLRTHAGGYEVMDAIRQRLTGFVPEPSGQHHPTPKGFFHLRTGLVSSEDSVWDFSLHYGLDAHYLPPRKGA